MPATYDPIATTTLGSAASSITFSSISSAYTDLRLVVSNITTDLATNYFVQFNNDTSSNYSYTVLAGDGFNSTYATRAINQVRAPIGVYGGSTTIPSFFAMDIFSYAGSTQKTFLYNRANDLNSTASSVEYFVGLWRSTSAINSIKIFPGASANFKTNTTATLYGILKA